MKADLLLLHAPSSWTFRDNPSLWGPISDVIPSTPIFEMYPLGFVSIAEYLNRYGYKVEIANIALRMLEDPKLNVEQLISSFDTSLFGIDLHWLVHANGSLELAKICKKIQPNTKIVFGGLSSTYYANELIQEQVVDFVVKGDSTELPLLKLLQELESTKPNYSVVPNLVYRDKTVVDNGITYVPNTLDDFTLDFKFIVNMLSSVRGIKLRFPYREYLKNPLLAIFSVKGCTLNCLTCGGSQYFYKTYCNRREPAFRSPERIINDLLAIESYVKIPVFILSELQQAGVNYWREIFTQIKKEQIDLPLVFELFYPAPKEFFENLASLHEFSLQISPETWSEEIRKYQGKAYSNTELEKNIAYALNAGVKKFDLYYMIGLSKQTREELDHILEYLDQKIAAFGERVHFFIAPLSPFLDPGALAFDFPQKYGFKRLFRDLRSHYNALENNSWKNYLNYESTLSREELVWHTYDVADKLFDIKVKHKYLSQREYVEKKQLLHRSWELYQLLEEADIKQDTLITENVPGLDASLLTTNKDLYFGNYSILNFRSFLRLIRKKLFG
ncbi:MAG: TIGR04190 family B12-binding domain/radical SAM domain protein [Candidatus Hodarchaeota archaeon]